MTAPKPTPRQRAVYHVVGLMIGASKRRDPRSGALLEDPTHGGPLYRRRTDTHEMFVEVVGSNTLAWLLAEFDRLESTKTGWARFESDCIDAYNRSF